MNPPSSPLRSVPLAIALMAALTACQHRLPRVVPDGVEPGMLPSTDFLAAVSELGVLRRQELPDDQLEIRLWGGFGSGYPQEMLRLQVDALGAATGAVYERYPVKDRGAYGDEQSWREHQAHMAHIRSYCPVAWQGVGEFGVYEICRVQPQQPVDWNRVFRDLLRRGVMRIPDESLLPEPEIDLSDGHAVVVELRRGADYRSYEVSNPILIPHDAAGDMLKVIEVVVGVYNQLIPPQPDFGTEQPIDKAEP